MKFINAIKQWQGYRYILACCLIAILSGCDDDGAVDNNIDFSTADVIQRGNVRSMEFPTGSVQSLPAEAPAQDVAKVELGRTLFWDPILSGNKDVACATCHLPNRGYSDNLELSIGVGGIGQGEQRIVGHVGFNKRNAQTILNTVFNGINEDGVFDPTQAPMFWDNRILSLEGQAISPIKSDAEMRGNAFSEEEILTVVTERLNENNEYCELFQQAYGTDTITTALLANALATFQRTLVANNSPFDRWMRGDANAMTDNQLIGMREFTRSNCIACHSGPMFSDYKVHILGVAENAKLDTPDEGDGNFAFRTPTLRNLNLTAPYMHNGSVSSLRAAVKFYDDAHSRNPNVPNSALDVEFTATPEIEGARLNRLIDFLNSLNDDQFDKRQPETVPSGLNPGGMIN